MVLRRIHAFQIAAQQIRGNPGPVLDRVPYKSGHISIIGASGIAGHLQQHAGIDCDALAGQKTGDRSFGLRGIF